AFVFALGQPSQVAGELEAITEQIDIKERVQHPYPQGSGKIHGRPASADGSQDEFQKRLFRRIAIDAVCELPADVPHAGPLRKGTAGPGGNGKQADLGGPSAVAAPGQRADAAPQPGGATGPHAMLPQYGEERRATAIRPPAGFG